LGNPDFLTYRYFSKSAMVVFTSKKVREDKIFLTLEKNVPPGKSRFLYCLGSCQPVVASCSNLINRKGSRMENLFHEIAMCQLTLN
jgi:hypothetical protein